MAGLGAVHITGRVSTALALLELASGEGICRVGASRLTCPVTLTARPVSLVVIPVRL